MTETGPRSSGLFDSSPKREAPVVAKPKQSPSEPKETFKTVERQHADNMAAMAKKTSTTPKKSQDEIMADAANSALNDQSGGSGNVDSDLEEMDRFTEDDIRLAEELIFKGFASFDVKMEKLPNIKFTICSTDAEEVTISDEIIYDMVKAHENDKGDVNLPANKVQSMRNALFVALCYKGQNGQELCKDTRCQLDKIKAAIARVSDLENAGELDAAVKLKNSLKKAIIVRATEVKRLPTPIIDFLTEKKYEFDTKMTAIMNAKSTLPKS